MRTVHVVRSIPASPERVFDLLADHANYDRFRGIRSAELVREGEPPPNGVGALRHVLIGPLRFDEEVTAYERPSRLDYLIVRINFPFEHEGGEIRLVEEDGGTRAEWTSTFRLTARVIRPVLEPFWSFALARGFRRVLEDVERILATRSAGA
jgi:uncharacterized protein YndB with AHSA1/START domain